MGLRSSDEGGFSGHEVWDLMQQVKAKDAEIAELRAELARSSTPSSECKVAGCNNERAIPWTCCRACLDSFKVDNLATAVREAHQGIAKRNKRIEDMMAEAADRLTRQRAAELRAAEAEAALAIATQAIEAMRGVYR